MKKINVTHVEYTVIQERRNHKFSNAHDDQHLNGELEQYAIYLLTGDMQFYPSGWDDKWQQREPEGSHRKNIIQAASLLLAELERRQRSNEYFTPDSK